MTIDLNKLNPNTPVIVGIGFCQIKSDNPQDCPGPLDMMFNAIEEAAGDAGSRDLLKKLDYIGVQKGSWEYRNPGKQLADRLGCTGAKSVLSEVGVLQLMLLMELCRDIANGVHQIGAVVGGECRYRDLRCLITGEKIEDIKEADNTPAPDVFYSTPDPFFTDFEVGRGIWDPIELYAVCESTIRKHNGLSIDQNRDAIASLYSHFSAMAAANPNAWNNEALPPEYYRDPAGKNTMVAFPYTKRVLSQWNVNQSVAIVVCSAAKALEMGLGGNGIIFPLSGAQSRNVVCIAQKPNLHTHPGCVLSGEKAMASAGVTPADIDFADLYSCFPSAVQSTAQDLKLPSTCERSVTGSMAIAGGPYNHSALNSVYRIVELLRNTPAYRRRNALATSISGMFGKHAVSLFSNQPNPDGFQFDDVTEQAAAAEGKRLIDEDYIGPATIFAYTVAYNKGAISHAIVYCDTPAGKRTVLRCDDLSTAEQMIKDEFIGQTVRANRDGSFNLMTENFF